MSIGTGANMIFENLHRRTIRSPQNPMDKATVVSIYPKEILERKETIQPGIFHLTAGSYNNPSVLTVGTSSWWREVGESEPLLEIPNSAIQIADSIVKDYANGLLACNMGDCMPGLFCIPGTLTADAVKKDYKPLLDLAQVKQKNWYVALVKIADTLWARTNGNPLSVSDDMRLAARELNLNNKDWLRDFQTVEMVRCVACGALRNPNFPICQTCKAVVDTAKAKELNLTFAS